MDTREILGVLALAVLWINSLLIFAVALRQAANVRAVRSRLVRARGRGELIRGEVASAGGEAFALRTISQIGRAMTVKGPERILFSDGPQSFDVIGGVVETPEGPIEVARAAPGLGEVWTSEAREQEVASRADARAFDAAYKPASTQRGFRREVVIDVRAGDAVWVSGSRSGDRLEATEDKPLLVSLVDPIAWCGGRIRAAYAFVATAALLLCGLTTLVLWPPRFGTLSTIGGALCLAYFILVQPAGVSLRDRVRVPSRRLVGGLWRRAAS